MKNISLVSASYKGLTFPELSFPHTSRQCREKGTSKGSTDLHLSSAITVSLLSVIMFSGTGNTHFSAKATGTLA